MNKYLLFYPEISVFQNFLDSSKLAKLKAFFLQELPGLELGAENETDRAVCTLLKKRYLPQEVPFLTELMEEGKQKLGKVVPKKVQDQLFFDHFMLKYYRQNDQYGFHQDHSKSGLSFLLQLSLNGKKFSDLQFADGRKIPFHDNQLIVFHSHLGHAFTADKEEGKGILLALPVFRG